MRCSDDEHSDGATRGKGSRGQRDRGFGLQSRGAAHRGGTVQTTRSLRERPLSSPRLASCCPLHSRATLTPFAPPIADRAPGGTVGQNPASPHTQPTQRTIGLGGRRCRHKQACTRNRKDRQCSRHETREHEQGQQQRERTQPPRPSPAQRAPSAAAVQWITTRRMRIKLHPPPPPLPLPPRSPRPRPSLVCSP